MFPEIRHVAHVAAGAMSRAFVVSQQKLSEKLTILKDRGMGMLTRIYNIKKGELRSNLPMK